MGREGEDTLDDGGRLCRIKEELSKISERWKELGWVGVGEEMRRDVIRSVGEWLVGF
jgi:hypothetical protein